MYKNEKERLRYNEAAVMRYRAESIEWLLENPKDIIRMINHHRTEQVPRLRYLESYYLANNEGIFKGKRRRDERKSDHRVAHGFAGIISNFINSYTLASGVKIGVAGEETSKFLDVVERFNQQNDITAHNIELGKDQNNLGRAYEMLVRNNRDETKLYRLDVDEVFMVHDTTVAARVIGAVRYYQKINYGAGDEGHVVELYSFDKIYTFEDVSLNESRLDAEPDVADHGFNGVPIVEYRSNRFKTSVFEQCISLIDAYDAAQSDTANYMTDFNDAILMIKGRPDNFGNNEKAHREFLEELLDANVLVLIPEKEISNNATHTGPMEAGYLVKNYDVQGVEAYKDRLKEDIFTLASVPNLADENFAGTQSGEALKYKMYGLQQTRSDKEHFLSKGFRVRYHLLYNISEATHEYTGELPDLEFTYTPNLPKSFLDELTAFINAGGILSNKTKLQLLSFIDNVDDELKKIEEEDNEKEDERARLHDIMEGSLEQYRASVGGEDDDETDN